MIDADGHAIEYLPWCATSCANRRVTKPGRGDGLVRAAAPRPSAGCRPNRCARAGLIRTSWWGLPTRNTLDRAPRSCPTCSRRGSGARHRPRDPVPDLRVVSAALDDAAIRLPMARAFNTFYSEAFRDHSETLTPVGIIPMHTPEEAIAELDHATGELGLKAFMFGGPISRPAPGVDPPSRVARWLDSLGLDSIYDYDPVWQRCVELGVSPTFHTAAMGWTVPVGEQLRVQPHRDVRDRGRDAGAVVVHGWRAPAIPARCGSHSRKAASRGRLRSTRTSIGHWEKRNRDAVESLQPRAPRPRAGRDAVRGVRDRSVTASGSTSSTTGCAC